MSSITDRYIAGARHNLKRAHLLEQEIHQHYMSANVISAAIMFLARIRDISAYNEDPEYTLTLERVYRNVIEAENKSAAMQTACQLTTRVILDTIDMCEEKEDLVKTDECRKMLRDLYAVRRRVSEDIIDRKLQAVILRMAHLANLAKDGAVGVHVDLNHVVFKVKELGI